MNAGLSPVTLGKNITFKNRDPIPFLVRVSALGIVFAIALIAESLFPLREATRPKSARMKVNLTVGAFAALTLRFLFYPLAFTSSWLAQKKRLGLLQKINVSPAAEGILSLFFLDWSFYLWHRALHHSPFLWRFHLVHHVDGDLDVSTTLRFHFGEMAFTGIFRALQVAIFGVKPANLALYEFLMMSFGFFHHSNLRLEPHLDEGLSWILITPKVHGMHHSIVLKETNSNFGTIFSLWDRAHRTYQKGVEPGELVIGVPSYSDGKELGLLKALMLPLEEPRPWVMKDGTRPERRADKKLIFLSDQAA